MKDFKILTVAIPTYNRAEYLKINLKQLFDNINLLENPEQIEIIVSDNASTDNTEEIINKFKNQLIPIIHLKNNVNLGFDGNFESCFSKATGKYVWIFGDDELLFNNALPKIIDILKNNDVGCLYLEGVGYNTSFNLRDYNTIPNETIELISSDAYIKKVNYYITFCTGNIFNKSIFPINYDAKKYIGTNLNQVYWYLTALKECNNNIVLKEKYFFIKESNTGGYNLFQTFSTNFNKILKENLDTKNRRIINNNLINSFFPMFICRTENFNPEKIYLELFKNYFTYTLFWKKIIFKEFFNKMKMKLRFKDRMIKFLYRELNSINNIERNKEIVQLIKKTKKTGKNFKIGNNFTFKNPQYMTFGDSFSALDRFRIEAWDKYYTQEFTPSIVIGNNVIFNTDIHIGCIDRIEIGDNCLFASRIYITDHHHGEPTAEMLKLSPKERPLVSKGPVIIKNNVWVGEGVAIMPGITIGENSIIATNAVVTIDVPANCVVGGVPAKVIKTIK